MAETISIDEILGGMTKEEFARARRLLPSQYSKLDENEYYNIANHEQRVAMLNAIYGSPAAWPEGEASALAEFLLNDSLSPYYLGMDEGIPLTSRIGKIKDFYFSRDGDGNAVSSFQGRIAHFDDLDREDRVLAESLRDSWLQEDPSGMPREDKERRFANMDLASRTVNLVAHPEMSDKHLREALDDLNVNPVARSALEDKWGNDALIPRFSTDSINQLKKVVRYDKLMSFSSLASRMTSALMKRPEVDAQLSLKYTDDGDWKKTVPILMDAASARKLLGIFRDLDAQGIEIDAGHPIKMNEAIALSSMLDDGSILAKADLSDFEYDLLSPAEENRVPIAKSTEIESMSDWDQDYDDAITLVTTYYEDISTTESTLYYLPDTDRYLLECSYTEEHITEKDGEYVNQNPEIEAHVEYEGGGREVQQNSYGGDMRIVTKKEAYEFLSSENSTSIDQIQEVDEIINRLKHEVAPDAASERGCDLDGERDDACGASGAMDVPAEQERRTDMGR